MEWNKLMNMPSLLCTSGQVPSRLRERETLKRPRSSQFAGYRTKFCFPLESWSCVDKDIEWAIHTQRCKQQNGTSHQSYEQRTASREGKKKLNKFQSRKIFPELRYTNKFITPPCHSNLTLNNYCSIPTVTGWYLACEAHRALFSRTMMMTTTTATRQQTRDHTQIYTHITIISNISR